MDNWNMLWQSIVSMQCQILELPVLESSKILFLAICIWYLMEMVGETLWVYRKGE